MKKRRQAVIPPDIVERLLGAAGPELVLVGDQSLAVWMRRYGLEMPKGFTYVSSDVDFLARSVTDGASVRRLAETLGGETFLPTKREVAFTSLVGQAVREVSEGEVYNVDVLHKMWGADKSVADRALTIVEGATELRVLHPLDVLKSRLDNLYGLAEKQNALGEAQLAVAIRVVQAFLREAAENEPTTGKRPTTLRYVGFIEKLATEDAGKKVAKRYGIHVADAIEPEAVRSKEFRDKMLPRLARLMSPARRKEISASA